MFRFDPIGFFRTRFGSNETVETTIPPSPDDKTALAVVALVAAVFFVGSLR